MKLENTNIVITGAGSGIGYSLAEQLASLGANLALIDLREERIKALAKKLERDSITISTHCADVSDTDSMQAIATEVLSRHNHVDILINNAGVTLWGYFEENTLDDFQWLFNINFFGVVYGCKFFLPHLKKRPESKIVNVSSMFGWTAVASQSAYLSLIHI